MTNPLDIDGLTPLFWREYQARMLHVQDMFRVCREAGFTVVRLDEIHQEFDSLVGATRAIDAKDLGKVCRALAVLSRYLRNQLPKAPDSAAIELMQDSVTLLLQGGDELPQVFEMDDKQVQAIVDKVSRITGEL